MSSKGQADLAARREEIMEHIRVVSRRRGPHSTIAIDVLASVLSAKFRVLRKDMVHFLEKSLTATDREELGILSEHRTAEVIEIDALPLKKEGAVQPHVAEEGTFTVEWITLDELRMFRNEFRAEQRRHAKHVYDSMKAVRNAERVSRASESERKREAARMLREEAREIASRAKQDERVAKAAERAAEKLKKQNERIALREARTARKGTKKTKGVRPSKPLGVPVPAQKAQKPQGVSSARGCSQRSAEAEAAAAHGNIGRARRSSVEGLEGRERRKRGELRSHD